MFRLHIGVREDTLRVLKTFSLARASLRDRFASGLCLAAFLFCACGECFRRHLAYVYPHVDAIGDRPRELPAIFFHRVWHAAATRTAPKAARTRVEGRNEHEVSGKGGRTFRASDRDHVFFQGLTERIDDVAVEFRELIGEEDAAVRKRCLTRTYSTRTTADEGGIRGGVVRRTKRRA